MARETVIISAARTPIGSFQGGLAPLSAPQLGSVAVRAAIERAGIDPAAIDEVLMGNVLSAGLGQAPARQAALGAGLPPSVGAVTINKVCGSGLKAVMLADQAIRAGDAAITVAGGMESMSNAPYLLPKARSGYRLGHGELVDSLIRDGLWDVTHDYHMGNTGELAAREYGVSREDQDRYALRSYERALAAQAEGTFDQEIVPVTVPGREGDTVVNGSYGRACARDEAPRPTSLAALAALKPVFDKGGTITAGNASKISDGAAALVLMAADAAQAAKVRPLARVLASATHSREPEWVMMAPTDAIRKAVARAGLSLAQIDLFEINEPFAAAAVAILRELDLLPEKVNVHGGAVALGHPIGATGARLLVTLLHALERYDRRYGVAALCLGGGEAVAIVVERLVRG
ncbi:MAG: acetyl-CoA C-acetyltransferase [Armatimonadetes bacterium]|nr:acetyl-CoA C-acetyltransferase [Armatimonadota bacterium]